MQRVREREAARDQQAETGFGCVVGRSVGISCVRRLWRLLRSGLDRPTRVARIAKQKVVGSSPIIRSKKICTSRLFVWLHPK
jgi:hypothetical protein